MWGNNPSKLKTQKSLFVYHLGQDTRTKWARQRDRKWSRPCLHRYNICWEHLRCWDYREHVYSAGLGMFLILNAASRPQRVREKYHSRSYEKFFSRVIFTTDTNIWSILCVLPVFVFAVCLFLQTCLSVANLKEICLLKRNERKCLFSQSPDFPIIKVISGWFWIIAF